MDMYPVLHSLDRIATALETIALNTSPRVITHSSEITISDEVAKMIERRRPPVAPEVKAKIERDNGFADAPAPMKLSDAAPAQADAMNDQVLGMVKRIFEDGTTSANGIAKELVKRGIPHPKDNKWNNLSAKRFMDQLGLSSPYGPGGVQTTKVAPLTVEAEEAPEPEPDPTPKPERKINRAFVAKEYRRRDQDAHMNLRGLLTPQTKARLGAYEQARKEGRAITDAELIAAAVAEGKVTKLPAGIDSEGNNHFEGSSLCTIRPSGMAVSLGSHGPSANGAAIHPRVSAR